MLSLITDRHIYTVLLGLDVLLKQHVEENIKSGEEKVLEGKKSSHLHQGAQGFLLNSWKPSCADKTVSIWQAMLACGAWCVRKDIHRKLGMAILGAGAFTPMQSV